MGETQPRASRDERVAAMATTEPTANASLPALRPIESKLSAAEKRERQRLHVKRTYYRKLQMMQRLRDEVSKLEQEYAQLVTETATRNEEPPVPESTIRLSNYHHPPAPLPALFHRLCETKQRLRTENEALRLAVQQHECRAQALQSLLHEERHDATIVEQVSQGAETTVAPVALRTPTTVAFCQEVARTTFADMLRFRESHGFLTTGVSVFGWRDKRLVEGDRLKFSMKKLFLNISPFELSLRGWSVVTSNRLLPSLYSKMFNVKTYTLQRVDEDNEIRYREMRSSDGRFVVKTLFLVSRFESPVGYALIFRSLDPSDWLQPSETPPGVHEQWIDYYNWTIFEAVPDDETQCKLDFGGETRANPVVGHAAWMLEILSVMLRWETIVIGPLFSLCHA